MRGIIFGMGKLEWLSYNLVMVDSVVLAQYVNVTDTLATSP